MNRKTFLKRAGLLVSSAIAAPYILPSGSLFAKTSSRKVDHVVFCLFAGGVRNIESVHQNEGGNLMPTMLEGELSQIPGLDPVPDGSMLSNIQLPLQQYGTLFKEFRYAEGPPGHYNGHTVAVTGAYTDTGLNLRENPTFPTIFEYYRKHNSPEKSALNTWWVSNALGPYPALNYSRFDGYGPQYGANFLAPTSVFNNPGYQFVGNARNYHPEETAEAVELRGFLDNNFSAQDAVRALGIQNTPEDQERLQQFILDVFDRALQGAYNNPMGMQAPNNDVYNILFAEDVIRTFQPELLVVNMQDVDVCHDNFTQYCNNLRKADYAVAHLWDTIQSTPGMADNTVMIIAPEHGRNFERNSVRDIYGKFAIDHTVEQNYTTAREIFCMILGPAGVVRQNNIVGAPDRPVGESIDIAVTIAELLGFYNDIPSSMHRHFRGRFLEEAFV